MKIFLVGFMGAGKSFLGKIWGEIYSIPFYDLDELIEEDERITVENIFATFGEDYFREREAAVLRNTDRFEKCIIACGGGTPCYFDNMHWMNKSGVTVFINESEINIFNHLKDDKKIRPLIMEKDEKQLQQFISNKLQERSPFYNESQIILQSHHLNKSGFAIIENYITESLQNNTQ